MSALQYGAMPGTLVAGVLGCILPYLTSNMEKEIRGTVLVRGNAFAAGVLSSAGLVHLLPDASKHITFTDYPFSFALAGVIFIVLLFIEMISHRPMQKSQSPPQLTVNVMAENSGGIQRVQGSHLNSVRSASTSSLPDIQPQAPGLVSSSESSTNITRPLLPQQSSGRLKRTLHVYVLAIGLVSHSIIAGLALSLTGRKSTQIGILVAVLAHKAFAAFALSNSAVSKGWSLRRALPLFALFCTSTPIGIGIGLGIKTDISESNQAVPILQAGASGVFLYMGFWHLLHDMITDIDMVDFFIYALGFGAMSSLAVWT